MMKANELMIGDFVQYKSSKNAHRIFSYRELDGILTRDFEPITLTAEILQKNGFVDIGDGIWQNEQYACGVDTSKWMFYVYVNDYDYDDCHDVAITCTVDKLQKALRLCERGKLAESIKI